MNDDIIYMIHDYVKRKENERLYKDRPIQCPFSRWAIDEIIYELQMDCTSYPDEILRKYIHLMDLYEDVAEVERKMLFRTARDTISDLYSYLFERN